MKTKFLLDGEGKLFLDKWLVCTKYYGNIKKGVTHSLAVGKLWKASGILREGQTKKLNKQGFIYSGIHIPEVVSNFDHKVHWGVGKGKGKGMVKVTRNEAFM